MKNLYLRLLIIQIIFVFVLNVDDKVMIKIDKSKSYTDQSNNFTPLVVSISSEDKSEKIRGVYIICIVDVSGSMSSKLNLVQESLKYIIGLMNEKDYLALVIFTNTATKISDFIQMTANNKNAIIIISLEIIPHSVVKMSHGKIVRKMEII